MSIRVSILNGNNPSWNDYDVQALQSDFGESGIVYNIIRDDLQVVERGLSDNYVTVKAGIAHIKITKNGQTYMVKLKNNATVDIQVPANSSGNPRKDIIVARIDIVTDPDNTSSNIGILELIEGTPDPSPVEPAVPANAVKLATIDVAHGQTVFTNGDITDGRTVFIINNLGVRLPNNVALQSRNAVDENLPVDLLRLDQSNVMQILPSTKFNAPAEFDSSALFNSSVNFPNVIPTLPNDSPTTDNQSTRKKYVDDEINALDISEFSFGGDGLDGDLIITSGTVTLSTYKVYQYSSIDIQSGATLAFGANFQGKVAVIRCRGDATIAGTIDLKGMGGTGGAGGGGVALIFYGNTKTSNPTIYTSAGSGGSDGAGDGSGQTGQSGGSGGSGYSIITKSNTIY